MIIFIDGDGCPVITNTITIAKLYHLPVIIVKNYHHVINDGYAKIISVDAHRDSADFYIINKMGIGDLIITQDYGLAALVLARQGHVITQNGTIINNNNINTLLHKRYINQELRRQRKKFGSKTRKRTMQDDLAFEAKLKELLDYLIP